MAKIIGLPKLSPTMEEGTLAKWVKQEGDEIVVDDLLAEVETDKATMEFRSFDKGTLLKLLVPADSLVQLGQPVAIIGEKGEDISKLVPAPGAATASAPVAASAKADGPRADTAKADAPKAAAAPAGGARHDEPVRDAAAPARAASLQEGQPSARGAPASSGSLANGVANGPPDGRLRA